MTDAQSPGSATEDPQDIWHGDLLDRKAEAELLIAYIESVATRPSLREDKRAYTIAVDAPYGLGKTFFLKRFAAQLRARHPVAFVDAWADDLADEPLTALAATLKEALAPFLAEPAVRSRYDDFIRKSGKVAAIVGKGLLRRGGEFLLGKAAVGALEAAASGAAEDVAEAVEDMGKGMAEDAAGADTTSISGSLMERRVKDFEEGRKAIMEMKASLAAIVASLAETDKAAPIVIVIDELDRCRPNYAVKLLEEIKHLFDVSGLVFVLGVHCDQLGHSVSGAYGATFDGRSYLNRFIDREYRLEAADLQKLFALTLAGDVNEASIEWPTTVVAGRDAEPSLSEYLAEYASIYDLGARDAFKLVDIIKTSLAILRGHRLIGAYFIPLAIGYIKHVSRGKLPNVVRPSHYLFLPEYSWQDQSDVTEKTLSNLAIEIEFALAHSDDPPPTSNLSKRLPYAWRKAEMDRQMNPSLNLPFTPSGYPRLLEMVGRFNTPIRG